MQRIKRFFITALIGGVVVLLPISIFVFVVRFLIRFVSASLKPISELLSGVSNGFLARPAVVDFIAFAIVLAFCFLVGLVVQTQIGKTSFSYFENQFLMKLPLYQTIRDIVQQFTGAKKTPFKQVVLADVFNNGTRMTGFVTDELEDNRYTIFVPTAPNPTNGFVFHVHGDQLTFLDTESQDAMRSVIGMGAGSRNLVKK